MQTVEICLCSSNLTDSKLNRAEFKKVHANQHTYGIILS